ncbi:hypothetical protein PR048_030389 [Dryococelus australis]|uniref:Uncharacterized protein n=1 Tax=Dryococelus australis TaxID=614101 RepID=A0ABQ9G9C1_9NEOP|nr:hypothetical protein PR048_030389 [Dryococelus australis]
MWMFQNMETYRNALSRLLTEMCLQRPLLIVIDSIDQVREYGTHSTDWLPTTLPENVKLILSVTQDGPMFLELQQKIPSASFIEVKLDA